MDMPDDEDLGWWIDPKDADPRSEIQRQSSFLRDARIICPGVDIFAVPNAAKRSQWETNKAKREGMRAGVLDLVCSWAGGVAFLEFKDGRKMPDANQRERLNLYTRQGHLCGVFRQEKSALEFLRRHGAPFIDRAPIAHNFGAVPEHLAALQLLVNRCPSSEGKKDLIVTAGACEAIERDEAFTILTANHLETA